MVYKLKLPMKDPTLTFQIYDKDILSVDDFISEGTIDFHSLAQEAFENDSTVKLHQNSNALVQIQRSITEKYKTLEDNAFNKILGKKEKKIDDTKKRIVADEKLI